MIGKFNPLRASIMTSRTALRLRAGSWQALERRPRLRLTSGSLLMV